MGALGTLFSSLFGFLFAFFARWLSAKVLIATTAITAFILLFGGLTILFNTSMSALSMSLPDEFAWGLGIIPTNVPVCVSTVITCRIAIWVVQIKWAIIKIKVQS